MLSLMTRERGSCCSPAPGEKREDSLLGEKREVPLLGEKREVPLLGEKENTVLPGDIPDKSSESENK